MRERIPGDSLQASPSYLTTHLPVTEEQAKLILSVHRSGDSDPDDSLVTDALALVATDSDLRVWYEREQQCIAALDAKFGEIAPPANLRARILETAPPTARSQRWTRRHTILAAAALLVISLVGSALWLERPFTSGVASRAAYQQDMATFLDRFFLLDYESDKIEDVTGWLARERGIKNFAVPQSLAAHPSLGCEVIPWNGRLTYLICFDVDGELYHLFLLPGGTDLAAPAGESKRFPVDPKWATASWSDGNDLYFCCSLEDPDRFRRILDRPVRMNRADSPRPRNTESNQELTI